MKKHLTFFVIATVLPWYAWAMFSQFVHVTPKVKSDHLIKVKLEKKGKDYLVSLSDIKKAYGWQIELDKPVSAENQNFRELIWKNKYTHAKVLKVTRILSNRTGKAVVVKKRISQDKINKTYFYFDHPTEIMDGGFYFTVDLATFVNPEP